MSMINKKKTPWINEGLVGFFEYDLDLQGVHIVARTKEDLQRFVTENLMHTTYDKVSIYIKEHALEDYDNLSEEEKEGITAFDFLNKRLGDLEYREEIYQMLLADGVVLPRDITVDEIGYIHNTYTDEEIEELKYFLEAFPSVSQVELEDIYLRQKSENVPYAIHRETIRNAEINIENYENSLIISELLVQNYEKELVMEEQLISNSEMIVELYEAINSEVEGK